MGSESFLERENRIRRKVDSVYNRQAEDFPTTDEFNNYLEEKEDIVYNLIERIDLTATTAKLAAHEKDHAETILSVNIRRAEAARVAEESSAVRMDHDDPHAPSASAKSSATTENPEGHSGMQYAAAAPCPLDTRPTPTLVQETTSSKSAYQLPDPHLSEQQKRRMMAKASGWHLGITAARARQHAMSCFS